MSTRYPGGLINRSAPVVVGPTDGEGGSAPGVWTLEQAAYYSKQGLWPLPVLPKPLWAFGSNNQGQLGQNDVASRSSPVNVGGSSNWTRLSSGTGNLSLFLNSIGQLWAVGTNANGNLGLGDISNRSSPVQVGSLTTWRSCQTGSNCSLATKTDGTLWAWGANNFGQLGTNDIVYRSSPVQVGGDSNWSENQSSIACGGQYNSYAIRLNGSLWAWGQGAYGQLGQNDTFDRSAPVQIGSSTDWVFCAMGRRTLFAIKTNGTLWGCGYNATYGAIGDGTTIDKSSPVQIGALTTWSSVSGLYYGAIAIKTDGTMWAWGYNNAGQLGQNDINARSSPVQIGTDTNWSNSASSVYSFVAVKTNGTLWACGVNSGGQLAQGDIVSRSSPVQIGSFTNWISAGAQNAGYLALKSY